MRWVAIIELCCWPLGFAFPATFWYAADFMYLSTINPNVKIF